jgi:ATP-dependent protease HslVU (ClpYQ) peptidase subunit
MTTIAAIQGESWLAFAAESADTYGDQKFVGKGDKVVERNGVLMGCAGEAYLCQLITTRFAPPKRVAKMPNENYLNELFIPSLKNHLTTHATIDEKTELEMLVGVRNEIYTIDSSFAWLYDKRGIYAIGSGGRIALGALAVRPFPTNLKTAQRHLKNAVEIACAYDTNSAPPIQFWEQSSSLRVI